MSNESIARQAAEKFRSDHGLDTVPIADMAQLIEHTVGAGVAYVRVPAEGHGMTMTLDGKTLVAVGCTPHPMRLRSTLAHELGHIVLGTVNREAGSLGWGRGSDEESQADTFARHLLVPLRAVREAAVDREPGEALLSDIVQSHMASPIIVAIQMREAGLIDAQTSATLQKQKSPKLATKYGWWSAYEAMSARSLTPKGPQRLTARAIEAYQWGVVSPAMVARLAGDASAQDAEARLYSQGIERHADDSAPVQAPASTGVELSPDELAMLMGEGR